MGFIRRLFNSEPNNADEQTTTQPDPEQVQTSELVSPTDSEQDQPSSTGDDGEVAATVQETQESQTPEETTEEPVIAEDNDDTPEETGLELSESQSDPAEEEELMQMAVNTRPLGTLPIVQDPTGHVMFGQASDTGMVRDNNQDAVLSFFSTSETVDEQPDFGVFIVADGMGGHSHGERASAIATRVVTTQMINGIYLPLLQGDNINDADRPTIAETLIQAVKDANEKILDTMIGTDEQTGTTVTALVVIDNWAHLAHVGDSRAYLISHNNDGGSIEQITRDHSLVQRLIELGQLEPEEAEEHPKRNVLYRAVGQHEELEVDTLSRRLQPGNYVLLCSDGLWGLIDETDLKDTIINTPDPQEACEKLIALANASGGNDNITAIILKIPGS